MARTAATINTTEASTAMGVQPRTFRAYCAENSVRPVSATPNLVLYRKSDVDKLIKKRLKEAAVRRKESAKTTSDGVYDNYN